MQHIVHLDTAFVRQHVTTPGGRVRLGVRIFSYGHDSTGSAAVAITPIASTTTATGQSGSTLVYEGHAAVADTVDSLAFTNFSVSKSSGGPEFRYLANYQLVLRGSPPPPAGVLAVGGLPSSRVYMRFDLPSVLIDSSTTIVRAALILHQRGDSIFSDPDSISLNPRVVIASPIVTDVSKAVLLLADVTTVPLLGVRVNPGETRSDTIVAGVACGERGVALAHGGTATNAASDRAAVIERGPRRATFPHLFQYRVAGLRSDRDCT